MSATFVSLTPVTLTNGSATKVSQSQLYAASVIIYADSLNTGNVYMGGSNVTVTNGIPIAKGQTSYVSYDLVYGTNGKIDLSKLYFDTDTTSNLIRITYVTWLGF